MTESILVTSARTEELNADTRASIIHVCRTAHQEDDFTHLFSYIPSGGIHVLAYREHELVSHAVATTPPGIMHVGNTVRRPSKGNAAFVHDLLIFLEDQGFPTRSVCGDVFLIALTYS